MNIFWKKNQTLDSDFFLSHQIPCANSNKNQDIGSLVKYF